MLTIINHNTSPFFNLALEEYVLKHLKINEDFILLWQNEPSVIIGRNQNTIEEINSAYIKDHHINVARRISGGGAVYHDFGNLNFTFVTSTLKDNLNNYRKFTEPVIEALNELGIPAEFSGRNDITVEGKKISGNAQSFFQNRMFHHGTILFNANLDMIGNVLDVKLDKILSKGIKSIRSRVTNIYPYLKTEMTIDEFRQRLLTFFLKTDDITSKEYKLTSEDLDQINTLMHEKYLTWNWNYGESPDFDLIKSGRYTGGKIDVRLNVVDGNIKECRIYGDYFGTKDIHELEDQLKTKRFEEQSIREVLANLDLDEYLFNITPEDFIQCLFY